MTTAGERRRIDVVRLGRTDYRACWALQRRLQERRTEGGIGDTLLLTEHEPVITLGTTANRAHLLAPRETLSQAGIDVVDVDRGGDVTFHGPGQIVGYLILDLQQHTPDLHVYLRQIEELIIGTLCLYDVDASRMPGYTGVWVGDRKICAIGVNVRRWVTMHGFALNVNTDLSSFRHIIPCGISGYGVTSLAELRGGPVALHEVEDNLVRVCDRVFHRTLHEVSSKELGIDSDALQRTAAGCV